MEINEYKNILDNEKHHFFYTSNRKIILSLINYYLAKNIKNDKLSILDAGCGTGRLIIELENIGVTVGLDISANAINLAKNNCLRLINASINSIPCKDCTFDLITNIDTLYHQNVEDIKAINELFRILKPRGILVMRVAANKWLKLLHDKQVHTRERYYVHELKNKLIISGFVINFISYCNIVLFPLAILKKIYEYLINSKTSKSEIYTVNKYVNFILSKLLNIEACIFPRMKMPFGLGIIVVCKKP